VTNSTQDYVSWFRASLPYINAHRGKLFVLMIGGEAIAQPGFATIIHDLALLNTLGVQLVIVHGSRPQIEQRLAARQLASTYHQGLRITDQEALTSVIDAAGALRAELEALLSMGLANSPMHRARIRVSGGNFVLAKPMGVVDGVDFQYTGEIRRIDKIGIQQQLEQRNIVIIGPLGYSPTGEIFNLNMEEVATQVATSLKAEKLIAFGKHAGIVDSDNQLRRELTLQQAHQVAQQALPDQQSRLFNALIRSSGAGIDRCHLISYLEDGALLKELFTRDGCGSLIYLDDYESIRTANIDDVGGILELISPLEEQGVLVRRSRELLETEIMRFTVVERDGMIIACAALYPYPQDTSGEIACVATHPHYRGGKRGERLLSHLEKQAQTLGLNRLFVLTTRTGHWFLEQGFSEEEQSNLPRSKQTLYNYQRNSKIFAKILE
jgi:amino-acid N-acetyltransferase